jgi:hypothetical protein
MADEQQPEPPPDYEAVLKQAQAKLIEMGNKMAFMEGQLTVLLKWTDTLARQETTHG